MKRLENKLHNEQTVLGIPWKEYLETVNVRKDSIIHTLEEPVENFAGIRILKGNISPNGAVCRPTGIPKSMWKFEGPARVFDMEEDAAAAIDKDVIQDGEVIVIRNEGPKGSPGMNELMKATDRLIAKGMEEKVALITDGRFSGFNHGSIIGHISPEAYVGGNIAFIRDGDLVGYNIEKGEIYVKVSDEELEKRRDGWCPPEQKVKKGLLSIYAATCKSADEGAAMQNWR